MEGLEGIKLLRLSCFQALGPDGKRSGEQQRRANKGQNVNYGSTLWFTVTPYTMDGWASQFEDTRDRGLLWTPEWLIENMAQGCKLKLRVKEIPVEPMTYRDAEWEVEGELGDKLSMRHAPWAWSRGFNVCLELPEDLNGGRIALSARIAPIVGGDTQAPWMAKEVTSNRIEFGVS